MKPQVVCEHAKEGGMEGGRASEREVTSKVEGLSNSYKPFPFCLVNVHVCPFFFCFLVSVLVHEFLINVICPL